MNDPVEGGRLIGEGCHFVDLLSYLAGGRCVSVHATSVLDPTQSVGLSDEVVATLRFANASVGTLVYAGDGDPRLAKERIEVFGGGVSAVLDDFRRLELYGGRKRTVEKGAQDKGHDSQIKLFLDSITGQAEAPDAQTYFDSSRATLALATSLRTGLPVSIETRA
jgi:polar amino acid transport system substrate-binding protein